MAPPAYVDWSLFEFPAHIEDVEQFEKWVLEVVAPVAEAAAARALLAALQFILADSPRSSEAREHLLPLIRSLEHWCRNPTDKIARSEAQGAPAALDARSFSEALGRMVIDEASKQFICAQVVPWALGYSDPVRDRVEARQREAAGE